MKNKKFNKKLSLNKQTITDLSSQELKNAKGGISRPIYICMATNFETCTCEISCYQTGIIYTCTTSIPMLNC